MVRFFIFSIIATAAVAPVSTALLLPEGLYRISCDSPRPPQGLPGRHFLAINSPSADATFSRYLIETNAPQWKVKRIVNDINYRIDSLSFEDVSLAYSAAEAGVRAKGDGGSDDLFNQWTIVDAQPTGPQSRTYESFVRPYNSDIMFLDCNHNLIRPWQNSSPAFLRTETTQNSVIPLYFERMGDLPEE